MNKSTGVSQFLEGQQSLKGQAPVVVLFAAMFLDSVNFPGLGVPVSSLAAGAVVAYALVAPRWVSSSLLALKIPLWFVVLVIAIPGWLAIASVIAGNPDVRRLLNVGVYAAVALILAGQRLSSRAIGRGLVIALVAGVVIGAALLPRSGYVGRMTGPLGDPNSAGFLIVVFAALALPNIKGRKYRLGLVAVAVTGVLLTQSRTSMLAMGIMALWVLVSRYVSAWFSVPFVALTLVWIIGISDTLAGDAFADRAGSDYLRERIYEVELAQVAISPLIGNGAGAAQVDLGGRTFFFHSSYLALRAEAGWVGLAIMISVLALVFVRLLALSRKRRNYYYEAALIGVAICAINLGEVFLALPAAFAIGLSMRHVREASGARHVQQSSVDTTSVLSRGHDRA